MSQSSTSTGIQFFNEEYINLILNCHGVHVGWKEGIIGPRYKYKGYEDLNNLYKLNMMFTDRPSGNIIDRSNDTRYPFKLHVRNPWIKPNNLDKNLDLETACNNRAKEISNQYAGPYNLYWSGGIDSTLLIISFMKVVDHKNLIVYLTKNSIKENKYFFENIIKPNLKIMYDTSVVSPIGSNITGECGDTIWAALDHSFFFTSTIKNYIHKPWQEWFETKTKDIDFLNFAEKFMKKAGRPINNLLDARWWFYLLCKSQSKATVLQLLFGNSNMIPFYESKDIETWAWYNIENIIKGNDWNSYKWPAKEIIYKFDKNIEYFKYKSKEYSRDLINNPAIQFKNNEPLFLTDNFEKPVLSCHPFFSSSVYKLELYEKYKHLFKI